MRAEPAQTTAPPKLAIMVMWYAPLNSLLCVGHSKDAACELPSPPFDSKTHAARVF